MSLFYLNNEPQHFSTFKVAKLLGVDMTTVIGWCKQGKLKAFRTPGKHRRIQARVLVDFLRRYQMPVPPMLEKYSQLRCLIVDDEPAVRIVIARVIKQLEPGVEIDMATDGFEAGKKVIEKKPHLVILDLNLPGIDGFKVCENIRKDDNLKNVKILAVTGMTTRDVEKKIRAAGADEFLAKPFGVSDIKTKILNLIGSEAS